MSVIFYIILYHFDTLQHVFSQAFLKTVPNNEVTSDPVGIYLQSDLCEELFE